jgi:hypothetical protein
MRAEVARGGGGGDAAGQGRGGGAVAAVRPRSVVGAVVDDNDTGGEGLAAGAPPRSGGVRGGEAGHTGRGGRAAAGGKRAVASLVSAIGCDTSEGGCGEGRDERQRRRVVGGRGKPGGGGPARERRTSRGRQHRKALAAVEVN